MLLWNDEEIETSEWILPPTSISSADSPCLGSPILHRSKTTVTQLIVHSDSDEVQEGVYRVERLIADSPCKSQKNASSKSCCHS